MFFNLYEVSSLGRADTVGSKLLLAHCKEKKWKYIADVFCASPCTIPLRHRAFKLCALACRSEQSCGGSSLIFAFATNLLSVGRERERERELDYFYAPPTAARGIQVCVVRGKRERKQCAKHRRA